MPRRVILSGEDACAQSLRTFAKGSGGGEGKPPARTAGAPVCEVHRLGRIPYEQSWQLLRDLATRRATGEIPDTLLLLEHPPVYTTGKRNAAVNLRLPAETLGAPLVVSDRGGDITFHGPGQLIAYPIINLRAASLGVVSYVRNLEEVIIRTLRDYGIESGLECGLTGVWVSSQSAGSSADRPSPAHGRGDGGEGSEKIAAIGVRVSRPGGAGAAWVTTHGLALNVDVDLAWFERIVPCGIAGRGVTSIERLLGKAPPLDEVAARLAGHFGEVLGRNMLEAGKTTVPHSAAV